MIWVTIMAAIGIGGGFAGLTAAWVSDVRAMDRELARCRRFRWCEFHGAHSTGRIFRHCPCVSCKSKRLRAEVRRFNGKLQEIRMAMLSLSESTRWAIAQLSDFDDVITKSTKENGL